MRTFEHPITQVPGLTPEQLTEAVSLEPDFRWYGDLARLDFTRNSLGIAAGLLGDDADDGACDALCVLLAVRGSRSRLRVHGAQGGSGLGLLTGIEMIQRQRNGARGPKDPDPRPQHTEVILDAFRRLVLSGNRKRTLTEIRRRLINAAKLSRDRALWIDADRLVRDTYAALHPDRQVREDFLLFAMMDLYRCEPEEVQG
ncbi:hypothetical protein KGD82_16230 [Nocardiopsis eucommiae]|uniref:Uncharacterized protein n=1 Tax=Nocardiopsis eucommiae TaxID=2831970 RepID=A0A975L5R8_9ACTN|nr:hypothetical protein KGD82_16230 [Nocardiopsis eucommiae]